MGGVCRKDAWKEHRLKKPPPLVSSAFLPVPVVLCPAPGRKRGPMTCSSGFEESPGQQ